MTTFRAREGIWTGKGLVVDPPPPGLETVTSFRFAIGPRRNAVAALLPELTLSLRDYLSHHLGDTPPPADPDVVRMAIDEQIEQLREQSAGSDSEDFRAGLAWAQHALSKVAEAAGRKRS